MTFQLTDLLHRMVESGASDLHLKVGAYPGLRIDGRLRPQEDFGILLPDHSEHLVREMLTAEQLHAFEEDGDLDCSYEVPNLARFRVNVLTQRQTIAMVLRLIPAEVPDIESLGLPPACLQLAMRPRGLVLVTGPTGSGKSTTLASMVDYINRNLEGHILTMEDPLEFVHEDKMCYVTQRQIGSDCKTFRQALRRGLRQDPDVILIGELRDHETIELAITAAETGHLVMATLHTTNAISTVDRIIDVFPGDAKEQVRVQLSNALQGVISQCLVSRTDGGLAAATEVLMCTDGVRSLIREGKTTQILNFLQTGSKFGMKTLEQSLVEMVNEGVISAADAIAKANRPQDVRRNVRAPANPAQSSMPDAYGRSASGEPIPTERPGQGGSHGGGAHGGGGGGTAGTPQTRRREDTQSQYPTSPQSPPAEHAPNPNPGAGRRGRRKGGLFDRK